MPGLRKIHLERLNEQHIIGVILGFARHSQ